MAIGDGDGAMNWREDAQWVNRDGTRMGMEMVIGVGSTEALLSLHT